MTDFITHDTVKTRHWHLLDDGRVQCDICPRFCKLHEGQRGLCFVRQNLDNQVVMTSYGRSSGFAIDPIEKKPLNHFLPGTPVLSFGTAGCNLACKFLPELGHQQIAGNGYTNEQCLPRCHCPGSAGTSL